MNTKIALLVALGAILAVSAGCASEPAGGTTTTTLPAPPGQQVVIAAPVRGEVQHNVVGTVKKIDRGDGEVTLETANGSTIDVKLPPFALASVREGDHVSINLRINPR